MANPYWQIANHRKPNSCYYIKNNPIINCIFIYYIATNPAAKSNTCYYIVKAPRGGVYHDSALRYIYRTNPLSSKRLKWILKLA